MVATHPEPEPVIGQLKRKREREKETTRSSWAGEQPLLLLLLSFHTFPLSDFLPLFAIIRLLDLESLDSAAYMQAV